MCATWSVSCQVSCLPSLATHYLTTRRKKTPKLQYIIFVGSSYYFFTCYCLVAVGWWRCGGKGYRAGCAASQCLETQGNTSTQEQQEWHCQCDHGKVWLAEKTHLCSRVGCACVGQYNIIYIYTYIHTHIYTCVPFLKVSLCVCVCALFVSFLLLFFFI